MQTIKQLLKIGVGAIIIGLTVTYVLAWTGPLGNPPTPNADAPITVSGTGQTKAGGLWLNTNNAPFGLIVDKGNVGIGTTNPGDNKLEVVGGPIKATGGLIIETRTSDPAIPVTGRMWLRTDL